MSNPLRCEKCNRPLESDDAISIIEGYCAVCRGARAPTSWVPTPAAPRPRLTSRPVTSSKPPLSSRPPLQFTPPPPRPPRIAPGAPAAPLLTSDVLINPATQRSTIYPAVGVPPHHLRIHRRRRDLLVGVGVGLVITIAITSYLVKGRGDHATLPMARASKSTPITLTVRPPNATIMLDGQPVGPVDEAGRVTLDLPLDAASVSWLEVTAKGYHTLRRPVSIYGGVPNVAIELIQKPYEVMVRTDPPHAEVWINNQLKGLSPLAVTLQPGEKAQLSLKQNGYEPVIREITPPADGDRLDLDFTLQTAGRFARIETDPPGAQILIDGDPKAIAPCSLPIDPRWIGRPIQLTASLVGHEDAVATLNVPVAVDASMQVTRLRLVPIGPQLRIATSPPGGRVVIDGHDYGPAPVVAKFPAGRAGSSATVEAGLGGTHVGRKSCLIPDAGKSLDVEIALAFAAHRVVFVLSPAKSAGGDHYALIDALTRQIHRLASDQQFTLLVNTRGDLITWPEGVEAPPATHHEKIRCYDLLRALRPTDAGDSAAALQAAMKLNPSVIWLFSAQALPKEFIDSAAPLLSGQETVLSVVTLAHGSQDDQITQWLRERRGSFTLLGRDPLPAVALDPRTDR